MAALLGLDLPAVLAVCEQAAEGQIVSPANLNSPGQIVIAGNREAVERAVKIAKEAGARRSILLQVSAPFHLSGSAANDAAARQAIYQFEIQARNLSTGQERVLATGQAFLRPQVKDYMARLSFAPPEPGQYRLRGILSIPQYHVDQDTREVALTTEH